MNPILITGILLSIALMLALMLALAAGVKQLQRISGIILAPAAVIGLAIYSAAFIGTEADAADVAAGVFRSVTATFSMFAGRHDFNSVNNSAVWFRENIWIQTVFWAVHLSALFVSASMLLSTLGKKLIQTIRLFFLRTDSVYIIYGLHTQSIYLGRDITRRKEGKVLYISPKPAPEQVEQVIAFGGTVRQEPYLPEGKINKRLMHLLGIKRNSIRKNIFILAFDDSETINFNIVRSAVDYFKEQTIPPEKVRILLRCLRELDFVQLNQFAVDGGPAYSIDAFSEAELSARLLIQESPPCKRIQFNPDGTATGDFCALIVGFGQVGQHALSQIIMNSQFVGSNFSAVVVDRTSNAIAGQYVRQHPSLFNEYNVRFIQADTRSHEFYDLLDELAPRITYVVVALGSDDMNYEAAVDIEHYFTRLCEVTRPAIVVNVCNKRNVSATEDGIRFVDSRQDLYSSELLLRGELDRMAKAVNLTYEEGKRKVKLTVAEADTEWFKLDYFTRESNRASADFIPAMLHIAGISKEEAADKDKLAEKMPEDSPVLEILGQTEKLRWNAFHYAMGFINMPQDEVRERAQKGITPFQKDIPNRLHACLVSWDELDEISALMTELTGNDTPYKEYDRRNIYNIPRTLSFINE